MDPDFLIRAVGLGTFGLGFLVFLVGGFLTPVSGVWRDGDRTITLNQFGPWLRGTAERDGGKEIYSGFAWFYRVWLARRSYGERHLRLLGFESDSIAVVEGAITARLRFFLRDQALDGEFSGVRFDFTKKPVRILKAVAVPGTPRSWHR